MHMNRPQLAEFLLQLCKELENKPFSYWSSASWPIQFQEQHRGHAVEITIDVLADLKDAIQLGVEAHAPTAGLSASFPVVRSIVIPKPGRDREST